MMQESNKFPEPALHASALDYDGHGILIRGGSRSGKSSLLMRLLDEAEARGDKATLIADDRVYLTHKNQQIIMHCPESIKGLLEVRGLGVLAMKNIDKAPLHLVVDLVPEEKFERYPPEGDDVAFFGQNIKRIKIIAKNPDGAAIIRTYLNYGWDIKPPSYQI